MTRLSALVLLVLGLAACGGNDVRVGEGGELLEGGIRAESTDVRGVVLAGRTLVLDGFAGDVNIVGTTEVGEQATLRFTRIARAETEAQARRRLVSISLEETGNGREYRYGTRTSRPDGAQVDIEARVPPGTHLIIHQDAGRVRVEGVGGDVEVKLTSGSIRAAGLGGRYVFLTTRAGNVEAGAIAIPAHADWDFSTNTGMLALTLPGDSPVRVDARTDVGTVRVDSLTFIDERLDRGASGMRFRGRLGQGDGNVALATAVGTVRLRGGRMVRLDEPIAPVDAPAPAPTPVPTPTTAPTPTAPRAAPAPARPPAAAPAAPRPPAPRTAPAAPRPAGAPRGGQ